jgi:hypothetical protein
MKLVVEGVDGGVGKPVVGGISKDEGMVEGRLQFLVGCSSSAREVAVYLGKRRL